MKKFLSTVLAMTLLFSMSGMPGAFAQAAPAEPFLEPPVQNVIATKGEIKEISKSRVWIVGEGAYNEIILNIHDGSYLLHAEDGRPLPVAELKAGDTVTAYYGPAVAYSMPPQGNAIALVAGTPKTGGTGMYMKVAKLSENPDGSIKLLCSNFDRLITIRPDVFPQLSEIKPGSELIVWYEVMTASIPGQAEATKVVLLPAKAKADIRVHTGAGVIVIDGKELALGENDRIETDGGTLLLPLRVIAESLGYTVVWDEAAKTVELQTGARTEANMTIGSATYGRLRMLVHLDHAPQLVNNKTLVPVEFFTDVLQRTVEINNSHI